MNLIEQLGGYEKAKKQVSRLESNGNLVTAEGMKLELLQYSREHNIFEEGDPVVFTDIQDSPVVFFDSSEFSPMEIHFFIYPDGTAGYVLSLSKIRHAEPEEIQANRRLDQIKCWSCDKTMMHKQRSENDGFCIHCNAEVCGG